MKRISWIVPFLFVAGTAVGQPAGVTVALTANSATSTSESVVGTPVTLTATVRTPGVAVQPVGGGGQTYDRDRLRFTFTAVRGWPCAKTITLADNVPATGGSEGRDSLISVSHTSTFSWVPQAVQSGEYTLSVHVTYLKRTQSAIGVTQIPKPESLGSAAATYTVKPPTGFPGNVNLTASPASGSTVPFPVNVTLYASASIPSDSVASKWRFTFQCQGGAPPKSSPIETGTTPSASWTTSVSAPGAHPLFLIVDKVRLSDCYWQFSHQVYNFSYSLSAQ